MPNIDGIEATRRIMSEVDGVDVIVLTSFAEQRKVLDALDAGASGYILKDSTPDEVLGAVRAADAGGAPLDPDAARVLLESQRGRRPRRGSAPGKPRCWTSWPPVCRTSRSPAGSASPSAP